MLTVLVVSVGGSCAPVVNACREYNPDYIYFLCSGGKNPSTVVVDGPGDPCGDNRTVRCPGCGGTVPLGNPKGKSIVHQLGLGADRYEKVVVKDPDDLKALFRELEGVQQSIGARFQVPAVRVVANYTGGTKTMSVALALVALLRQWELSLSKGERTDLIMVRSGDIPVLVDRSPFVLEYHLERVRELLNRYDYRAAEEVLAGLTRREVQPGPEQEYILRLRRLCRAFSLWDTFDHAGAYNLLRVCGGQKLAPYLQAAAGLARREKPEEKYASVMDLVLNAARRAEQERYDDAVARLYRALELVAQVRLVTQYHLETGNLGLAGLPETLRGKYVALQDAEGRVKLALVSAYRLLQELNDPVGQFFGKREKVLLDALQKRNFSILAHGLQPLAKEDYEDLAKMVVDFIQAAVGAAAHQLRAPQLPRAELLEY